MNGNKFYFGIEIILTLVSLILFFTTGNVVYLITLTYIVILISRMIVIELDGYHDESLS